MADNDETFTLVVPPESPCGCGSGKQFEGCHLIDGHLQIGYKNINPLQPVTAFSRDKCHFAFTGNCDQKLEKEHILSKTVLKEIGGESILLTKGGVSRVYAIKSPGLTVKRLCARHNRAFSPVDAEAGRFLRALKLANSQLASGAITQPFFFFHYFDLERWLLKTMLNVFYSSTSERIKWVLPSGIEQGFNSTLRYPYGIYFESSNLDGSVLGVPMYQGAAYELMIDAGTVVGIKMSLAGFAFTLIAAGTAVLSPVFHKTHTFRPLTLNFTKGKNVVTVMIMAIEKNFFNVWLSQDGPDAKALRGIAGPGVPEDATFFRD